MKGERDEAQSFWCNVEIGVCLVLVNFDYTIIIAA